MAHADEELADFFRGEGEADAGLDVGDFDLHFTWSEIGDFAGLVVVRRYDFDGFYGVFVAAVLGEHRHHHLKAGNQRFES